jgi:hypothetical protein
MREPATVYLVHCGERSGIEDTATLSLAQPARSVMRIDSATLRMIETEAV